MTFKPEITLGQVVELVVFVVAVVGTVRKFGAMEQKLNTMYAWFVHSVLQRDDRPGYVDRVRR